MEQKIKSVSEAYSMQPRTYSVTEDLGDWQDAKTEIKEIKIELVYSEGDGYEFYVCRNFHGNKLFEFPKLSVSVSYFPPEA